MSVDCENWCFRRPGTALEILFGWKLMQVWVNLKKKAEPACIRKHTANPGGGVQDIGALWVPALAEAASHIKIVAALAHTRACVAHTRGVGRWTIWWLGNCPWGGVEVTYFAYCTHGRPRPQRATNSSAGGSRPASRVRAEAESSMTAMRSPTGSGGAVAASGAGGPVASGGGGGRTTRVTTDAWNTPGTPTGRGGGRAAFNVSPPSLSADKSVGTEAGDRSSQYSQTVSWSLPSCQATTFQRGGVNNCIH